MIKPLTQFILYWAALTSLGAADGTFLQLCKDGIGPNIYQMRQYITATPLPPKPSPPPGNGTDTNSTDTFNILNNGNTTTIVAPTPLPAPPPPPRVTSRFFNMTACQAYSAIQSKKTTFRKNDRLPMYIKATFTDFEGFEQSIQNQYFPAVDQYSGLIVKNVSGLLRNFFPNITVSVLVSNPAQPDNVFQLSTRESRQFYKGPNNVVPYRTITVTLRNGAVLGVDWEPMWCNLGNVAVINNTCAYDCNNPPNSVKSQLNCDQIRIYVQWVGTDVDGKQLTSSNRSIWRLQSLP